MKFNAEILKSGSGVYGHYISVPEKTALKFFEGKYARVVCTLNGSHSFQCAILPSKKHGYFIQINKKIRDKLSLKFRSQVKVEIKKDKSKYGLPMTEEFKELLSQDLEGDKLFHQLTAGKQRTLLYIAGNVKNSDKRISRAIAIVNHLKAHYGKIDFKQLQIDIRNGS